MKQSAKSPYFLVLVLLLTISLLEKLLFEGIPVLIKVFHKGCLQYKRKELGSRLRGNDKTEHSIDTAAQL